MKLRHYFALLLLFQGSFVAGCAVGCAHKPPACRTEACQLAQHVLDEPRRRAEAAQAQQEGVDAVRRQQNGGR